jgi:hypothetical protein
VGNPVSWTQSFGSRIVPVDYLKARVYEAHPLMKTVNKAVDFKPSIVTLPQHIMAFLPGQFQECWWPQMSKWQLLRLIFHWVNSVFVDLLIGLASFISNFISNLVRFFAPSSTINWSPQFTPLNWRFKSEVQCVRWIVLRSMNAMFGWMECS